ncbi:DUF3019 domain-containing protein [Microbulbifer agarilyticus]|uniref:DUF3019 domain-containing protein n=1 Tax=Microbulbifer agarilyticus TaxID=260552 RepID=UPI001C98DDEC|nr:DUF3019 domain-containing protein [Microbulbifer agarilyticus]MBY6191019.1 DUF3019 domain-containing protein [Microbulbifer agarilyticus]
MKRLYLILFSIFLLGTNQGVLAAELRITPSLCAVAEDEELCSISVTVDFQAKDDNEYCLIVSGRGLVSCFSAKNGRSLQVYVSAQEDLSFEVTNSASGLQVAQTTLKVAKFRPKRHQRRYGWGFL